MTPLFRALALVLLVLMAGCTLPPAQPDSKDALVRGLSAYEQLRAALAADNLGGLAAPASAAAVAFAQAAGESEGVEAEHLGAASAAAQALSTATGLDQARVAFGTLSEPVVALVSAEPALQQGLHRFTCPMAPGYGDWLQPGPEFSNPYMGTAMPGCGTAAAWEAGGDHADHSAGDDEIAYWTCAMHPSVKEAAPGTCPICSMDLTPVTRAELESGSVIVDAVRRQRFGVRTAPVEVRPLVVELDAVGSVTWDEGLLTDVTLRTEVWVERLHVSEPGSVVRRGQALATLYSPTIYAAQRELLATLGTERQPAARDKLRLLGLSSGQIEAVLESGEARDTFSLLAPRGGVVVDKDVVEGAHLRPGSRLFRIAGLERVWVEAELYEDDLDQVAPGSPVSLRRAGASAVEGAVARVVPWVERDTRRATVRVFVDNPDGAWRPGQYVDLSLSVELGEAPAVPAEAVIHTGRRRIVFVDEGEDRLVPRDIEVGRRAGAWFEVASGLVGSERVVSSGTFLVAAESRIRAAETYWAVQRSGGPDGTD